MTGRGHGIRGRGGAALRYAPVVRESVRFALRELRGRRAVRAYRPRGAGVRVLARHCFPGPGAGSQDLLPLHEVFREGCYDPPPPVARVLDGGPRRVVDLGGHLGYFGARVLARHPSARVVAFEPEPEHARLLRETIRLNGFGGRWELVEACAHVADGRLPLAAGESVATHVVMYEDETEASTEVSARDVFPYLDGVDLLKIDIEGAEWAILHDERFAAARPRAVVLEYHSPGCPEDNPKRAAIDRFRALGYEVHVPLGDPNPDSGPFWGRGLLWAWRP